MKTKTPAAGLLRLGRVRVYGAGFIKDGADIKDHPRLVSFDGLSAYFWGMTEKEAGKYLEGITLFSGRTGWLAYILQDLFYDEGAGAELYEEIFDGLDRGFIRGPAGPAKESIFLWVEAVAPEVERIKERIISRGGGGL